MIETNKQTFSTCLLQFSLFSDRVHMVSPEAVKVCLEAVKGIMYPIRGSVAEELESRTGLASCWTECEFS